MRRSLAIRPVVICVGCVVFLFTSAAAISFIQAEAFVETGQTEDSNLTTPVWVEQGPGPILNGQTEGLPGPNPVSGAVEAVAVAAGSSSTVYAATVNGGIWKTTNATSAKPVWKPLTDQKLPALSMNSLAISPLNSSVLFAGTGSVSAAGFDGSPGFGVARSADGGLTWKVLAGATFKGRRINSIVPTKITTGGLAGQVVLASTLFDEGGGVWRSANGGSTFTRISGKSGSGLPAGGVSSLVADPGNSKRFYAGVPGFFGAGSSAGVYRSNDGGLTWKKVNSGLSGIASSGRILLSVSAYSSNPNAVYAMIIKLDSNWVGTLSGVYRSANLGSSWQAVGSSSLPDIFPGGQGYIHGCLLAHPKNPNVVFIAGDRQALPNSNGCNDYSGNVFRGDASSGVWDLLVCNGAHGTSPHADGRSMAFDAAGNLLQGNDGGIYKLKAPDAPSTRAWVSINGNIRPTEFISVAYDSASKVLFGGAQDTGTSIQNLPGSLTWTELLGGDGGVVAVDEDQTAHPGTSIRYTSYNTLGFFNRTTWNSSNTMVGNPVELKLTVKGTSKDLFQYDQNIQFYNPYVLNRIDPARMLIGTASIYESLNKGDTLTDLGFTGKWIKSLSYGSRLNGVTKPDVFYVGMQGSSGPYILHRVAIGTTLKPLTSYPGSGVVKLVMDPQNYRKVYVVDDQKRVWASSDEGVTWVDLTANIASLSTDLRAVEVVSNPGSTTILVSGGIGGVFRMIGPKAGATWTRLGTGIPRGGMVDDLHYNYNDKVLVAGIMGRGAWKLPSFGTTLEPARDLEDLAPLAMPEGLPTSPPKAAVPAH